MGLQLILLALWIALLVLSATSKKHPKPATRAFVKKRSTIMSEDNKNKTKKKDQKWFPLESNPALMNDYVAKLGFNTDLYEFVDVFSAEDWALQMIPQPVAAVIMLYPLTPKQLEHEKKQHQQPQSDDDSSCSVWFIKQRIGNACGTIGLLHSLLNAPRTTQSIPTGIVVANIPSVDCVSNSSPSSGNPRS